jgi:hypothetical protein
MRTIALLAPVATAIACAGIWGPPLPGMVEGVLCLPLDPALRTAVWAGPGEHELRVLQRTRTADGGRWDVWLVDLQGEAPPRELVADVAADAKPAADAWIFLKAMGPSAPGVGQQRRLVARRGEELDVLTPESHWVHSFVVENDGTITVAASTSPREPATLWQVPVAGGAPEPIEAQPEHVPAPDLLVAKNTETGAELVDAEGGVFVASEGVVFASVARLDPQLAAVLVRHDTSRDGRFTLGDEADLCVVQGPTERPAQFTARDAPGRWVPHLGALEALAGGTFRFEEDGTSVVVQREGSGPEGLDALRAEGRSLQAGLAELADDPQIHLSVSWDDSRHVMVRWDSERRAPSAWAGASDVWVPDRADYAFEADPSVTAVTDPYGLTTYSATCKGTVRNLTEAPLELEVICAAKPTFEPLPERSARGSVTVKPGKESSYSVRVAKLSDVDHWSYATRFEQDDQPIQPFNTFSAEDGEDWLEVIDALVSTGLRYTPKQGIQETLGMAVTGHADVSLVADEAFFARPSSEQKAKAREAWKLVAAHFRKFHGYPEMIFLDTPKSAGDWLIDEGRLWEQGAWDRAMGI